MHFDLWHYLCVFTRISVFMALCPVFFPAASPRALKAVACVAFTLALAPLPGLVPAGPATDAARLAALLREALLGAVMGSAIQIPFAALRGAGALMDMQTGLSMAHMVDPSGGGGQTALSSFLGLLSLLVFLTLDGHLWLLKGLAAGFTTLPVGGRWPSNEGLGAWLALSSQVLTVAVQAAAPIIALMLLTEVALGVISRVLPQLNMLVLGQPVRFALGLGSAVALLGLLEPLTSRVTADFLGRWAAMIAKL